MSVSCCGGTLPVFDPSYYIREAQLAEALFHLDNPVGVFRGQHPYLRHAMYKLKYPDGYPAREGLIPVEEQIRRELLAET